EWHREDRSDVARTQGPIQVWHRTDTIPTDAQGGYAGGDSTAAAIALSQGSVDALAEQVADINVGVGTLTARDNGDGTGTIVWTENAGSNGGGGDGDGHGVHVPAVPARPRHGRPVRRRRAQRPELPPRRRGVGRARQRVVRLRGVPAVLLLRRGDPRQRHPRQQRHHGLRRRGGSTVR